MDFQESISESLKFHDFFEVPTRKSQFSSFVRAGPPLKKVSENDQILTRFWSENGHFHVQNRWFSSKSRQISGKFLEPILVIFSDPPFSRKQHKYPLKRRKSDPDFGRILGSLFGRFWRKTMIFSDFRGRFGPHFEGSLFPMSSRSMVWNDGICRSSEPFHENRSFWMVKRWSKIVFKMGIEAYRLPY